MSVRLTPRGVEVWGPTREIDEHHLDLQERVFRRCARHTDCLEDTAANGYELAKACLRSRRPELFDMHEFTYASMEIIYRRA